MTRFMRLYPKLKHIHARLWELRWDKHADAVLKIHMDSPGVLQDIDDPQAYQEALAKKERQRSWGKSAMWDLGSRILLFTALT